MKASLSMIILSSMTVLAGATIKHFWAGKTMSKSEVEKKWGHSPLIKENFRSASKDERAKMAFSILEHKKDFIGLDTMEIRKVLGDFDGHYFRDSIPTYVIHLDRGDHQGSWQLVFLLDNDFKVSDIIVHKMRQLD